MKKKKFFISHFILCIFLICAGIFVGYLILSNAFFEIKLFNFIEFVFLIPTFIVACILPIFAGISYLISILKGEDDEMYPVKTETVDELLNHREHSGE